MAKTRSILLYLILALGIANGLMALGRTWERRSEPDWVGESERRYARLRADPNLPAVLSYAGDPDAFHVGDHAGFRLMQYTLAPTLITDRLDQEWLVWNGPAPIRGEPTLRGYSLSRKLGEDLDLYRRGRP
ncbi:MAG TPA: hypothetical protein VJR29_08510 [bacterium]|nr:hypothetical protein [bacterium]